MRWMFTFLAGMALGACVAGFAWSFSQVEPVRDAYQLAEPTEAVLWAVDVDGESAP